MVVGGSKGDTEHPKGADAPPRGGVKHEAETACSSCGARHYDARRSIVLIATLFLNGGDELHDGTGEGAHSTFCSVSPVYSVKIVYPFPFTSIHGG